MKKMIFKQHHDVLSSAHILYPHRFNAFTSQLFPLRICSQSHIRITNIMFSIFFRKQISCSTIWFNFEIDASYSKQNCGENLKEIMSITFGDYYGECREILMWKQSEWCLDNKFSTTSPTTKWICAKHLEIWYSHAHENRHAQYILFRSSHT